MAGISPKPFMTGACKGLSKALLYGVAGWQELAVFQLQNENVLDVAFLLAHCSEERVISCPFGCTLPFGLRHVWAVVVGGEGSRVPCL